MTEVLSHFKVAVEHFTHYTMGTPLTHTDTHTCTHTHIYIYIYIAVDNASKYNHIEKIEKQGNPRRRRI